MNNSLLNLLHLSDPTLPIGGFSHSAGLETYVQAGSVHNKETAKEYIKGMLFSNIQHSDAALLSLAFDAAVENNIDEICELDQLCHAIKLPEEIRIASTKLGIRLHKIFIHNIVSDLTISFSDMIESKIIKPHYCIAFALYAVSLKLNKSEALSGFYYNALTAMVNNCVKLIPLGQQDGQKLLYTLMNLLNELVTKSLNPDQRSIGISCAGFDIRSMQHEQLYSRLYMS